MFSKSIHPIVIILGLWAVLNIRLASAVPRPEGYQFKKGRDGRPLPPNSPPFHRWKVNIARPDPICRVGYYTDEGPYWYQTNGPFWWEGTPLSTSEFADDKSVPDNVCFRFGDIRKVFDWERDYHMYAIRGYCKCTLYRDGECSGVNEVNSPPVPQQNVFDAVVARRRPFSFKCFRDNGYKEFKSCTVVFSNGGEFSKRYHELDRVETEEIPKYRVSKVITKSEIAADTGRGNCTSVFPNEKDRGFVLRAWEIIGCSCSFFSDDKCEHALVIDGTIGQRVVKDFEATGDQQIRSYRCDLPMTADTTRWLDREGVRDVDWDWGRFLQDFYEMPADEVDQPPNEILGE
ncbi:hypothetical protein TWF281_007027 [Arthrobotrys megalospora]